LETSNASIQGWTTGPEAWDLFVGRHPELGYRAGKWRFHNFLRSFREPLLAADAIRCAQGRRWVAHCDRFEVTAFGCATGVVATKAKATSEKDPA
jgi:hypothetical protein